MVDTRDNRDKISIYGSVSHKGRKPYMTYLKICLFMDSIRDSLLSLEYSPEGFALVDGHTRREASIITQLETIPVIKIEFDNDQDALDYAIHLQKDRRNIY